MRQPRLGVFRSPIEFLQAHGLRALLRRRRPRHEPTIAELRAMTPAQFDAWKERSGYAQEIRDAHASAEAAGH